MCRSSLLEMVVSLRDGGLLGVHLAGGLLVCSERIYNM
jgi:hypothetical protein